jgi:hypothetical protein
MSTWTIPNRHPDFENGPPCALRGNTLEVRFSTPSLNVADLSRGLAEEARRLLTPEGREALERHHALKAERAEHSQALQLLQAKIDGAEAKRRESALGRPEKGLADRLLRQDDEIAHLKADLEQTRRRLEIIEPMLDPACRAAEDCLDLAVRKAAAALVQKFKGERDAALAALSKVAGDSVEKVVAVLFAIGRVTGDRFACACAVNQLLNETPAAEAVAV